MAMPVYADLLPTVESNGEVFMLTVKSSTGAEIVIALTNYASLGLEAGLKGARTERDSCATIHRFHKEN